MNRPAALDPQFCARPPRPRRTGCSRDGVGRIIRVGSRSSGTEQFGCRNVLGRRHELEDAEHHLGDDFPGAVFASDLPEVACREEPALTESGPLGADDLLERRLDRHLLAGTQVAVVDLVAVGGDHRRVAGVVEDLRHPPQRIVLLAHRTETAHGPYLHHRGGARRSRRGGGRRRRPRPRKSGSRRRFASSQLRIIGMLIGSRPRGACSRRARLDLFGTRRESERSRRFSVIAAPRQSQSGHRDQFAHDPRWTPPPKVITTLRLTWTSSQRMSAPSPDRPGSPCAPTISSTIRPPAGCARSQRPWWPTHPLCRRHPWLPRPAS